METPTSQTQALEMFRERLASLCSRTRCLDLATTRNLVVIRADMEISEACQTLVEHKISSVPVFDEAKKLFVGSLDFRDLVSYILLLGQSSKSPSDEHQSLDSDLSQSLADETIRSHAMSRRPVDARMAVDLSRKNPFESILPESRLETALSAMKNGAHSLHIIDANNALLGIVSQSDVIKWLSSQSDLMELAAQISLKAAGLLLGASGSNSHHKNIIFAHEDELVHSALKRMKDHGISSIAVTNSDNTLLGNISMEDIQYVFIHSKMASIRESCSHFISKTLYEEGLEDGRDRYPFFGVLPEDSLAHVLRKLVVTSSHRVWIVDDSNKLSGIVSLTDIISVIFNH